MASPKSSFATLALCSFALLSEPVSGDGLRTEAQRLRKPDTADQSSSFWNLIPDNQMVIKSVVQNPWSAFHHLTGQKDQLEEFETVIETMDTIITQDFMSMTYYPSAAPSFRDDDPVLESEVPTKSPTLSPTLPPPTSAGTGKPTPSPTDKPSSLKPTTDSPTLKPGTGAPTLPECGITEEERIARILAILDEVANPDDIRDNTKPQGLATTWLIEEDGLLICPDDPKIIQRWALAVTYYSTNGDGWKQCSANKTKTDDCGNEKPFFGEERFLSPVHECEWAGISCIGNCVSEIEFELNDLAGTIPTEIGLLSGLMVFGMEQGELTGTIPTEIGRLSDLVFIDLDFNMLSGTLSSELLSLSKLETIDLNNNKLSGPINGIGVFPNLFFLQLQNNDFTGTIPDALGASTKLDTFNIHRTRVVGTMPESICDLWDQKVLTDLIANCNGDGSTPQIECSCCEDCRQG